MACCAVLCCAVQFMGEATVTAVGKPAEGEGSMVELDQTVFYPQGGGQPTDIGVMSCGGKKINVSKVQWRGKVVEHIGVFEGEAFAVGDKVKMEVCDCYVPR